MMKEIFSALCLTLFAAIAAFAADPSTHQPASAAVAKDNKPINTICPVSGDELGSIGKPVYAEYHGKKIGFCCKDCAKKFQKNPDKYGTLAEKNQSAHEDM